MEDDVVKLSIIRGKAMCGHLVRKHLKRIAELETLIQNLADVLGMGASDRATPEAMIKYTEDLVANLDHNGCVSEAAYNEVCNKLSEVEQDLEFYRGNN